jgi:hypothetical protein
MAMQKRHLINSGYLTPEIFISSYGTTIERAGTPMLITWGLEKTALQLGWKVGSTLGTETDLIARLGVTRDTLREAVRVVEARGSMQMLRGRSGGLQLLFPSIDEIAAAYATYLRANGWTDAQFAETSAIAEPIFERLGKSNLIVELYHRVLDAFAAGKASVPSYSGRSGLVARRLAEAYDLIPDTGMFLGDEANLCES